MYSNGNKILIVNTFELFQSYWAFLLEGIMQMRKKSAEQSPRLTIDEFMKVTLSIALEPARGTILVLQSKNDKELGYLVLVDNTNPFGDKTCVVFALYSNCKCATTVKDLSQAAHQWATTRGFKRVQGCDFRMNSGSKKFFTKKLQMHQVCEIYEVEL